MVEGHGRLLFRLPFTLPPLSTSLSLRIKRKRSVVAMVSINDDQQQMKGVPLWR
ncbi:hypothetical protein HanRHA438_Chr15g0702611 [Helianthus annuus]|nr:hypothetical protein HanRHA438_Chr15g0702611 [Helianthus annuus]